MAGLANAAPRPSAVLLVRQRRSRVFTLPHPARAMTLQAVISESFRPLGGVREFLANIVSVFARVPNIVARFFISPSKVR
jgi:hypothetical protein